MKYVGRDKADQTLNRREGKEGPGGQSKGQGAPEYGCTGYQEERQEIREETRPWLLESWAGSCEWKEVWTTVSMGFGQERGSMCITAEC